MMDFGIVGVICEAERKFDVGLPYDEYANLRTVGDLYRLVLREIHLEYRPGPEIEREPLPYPSVIPPSTAASSLWTNALVWKTLKRIIVDELRVDARNVRESASFRGDLGADWPV